MLRFGGARPNRVVGRIGGDTAKFGHYSGTVDEPIDLDTDETWPARTRRWANEHADRHAGSTEYVADLAISLEEEDEFRETFGSRKLLGYHCTRLLPHEADAIRGGGLRVLDEQLVEDRIASAIEHNALSKDVLCHAETRNVYAIGNADHRGNQICLVVGRTIFDEDPDGCDPLLRHWGGEAIRGGPGPSEVLATLGTPSIVVARLALSGPHSHHASYPALAKLFVGALLELEGRSADLHYRDAVPGRDIVTIWQPGSDEYDRHTALPR